MKKGCGILLKHPDEVFFGDALPEGDFFKETKMVIPIGTSSYKMKMADLFSHKKVQKLS